MIGSFLSSIGGQMCNWCHYQKSFTYLLTYVKQQINSTLPWVCTVVDHRRCQNVIGTSVTHSAVSYGPHFLFLPYFVWGPATLGKINTTQQLLCIQIPCILVQDNYNEWQMRIYLATIWSYCFLHSFKSFAKTNLAKIAKKNCRQHSSNTHGVGNYAQGILSAAL